MREVSRKKKPRKDRRRWVTRLTEDVPPGPQGQPSHKAGTEVTVVQIIELQGLGKVSFAAPTPSSLLLEAAKPHVQRADRFRKELPQQIATGGWRQPFADAAFTNEALVYDFFQEAMAGILLVHAALDSFANELMPDGFVFDHDGKTYTREELEQRGIELRLSRVAAAATGRPNMMSSDVLLWDRFVEMKTLRDDIAHLKASGAYSTRDLAGTIWQRLFDQDSFGALAETAEQVLTHYGPQEVRQFKIEDASRGEELE